MTPEQAKQPDMLTGRVWRCRKCLGLNKLDNSECFSCATARPEPRDAERMRLGAALIDAAHGRDVDMPQPAATRPAKPSKASDGPRASKEWLTLLCQMNYFEPEHVFAPPRKWRFDWAIPSHRVAIEWEGIFAGKSRHTTLGGYSKDAEKYNKAEILGWIVLRFTAMHSRAYVEETIRAAVAVGGETWGAT